MWRQAAGLLFFVSLASNGGCGVSEYRAGRIDRQQVSAGGQAGAGGSSSAGSASAGSSGCACMEDGLSCLGGECVPADSSPTLALTTSGTCLVSGGASGGGELYCFGRLEGTAETSEASEIATQPTALDPSTRYRQVSTGAGEAYCALTTQNELRCWGGNGPPGVLGLGDFDRRPSPTSVSEGRWITSNMGSGHACALAAGGALWCWGRNADGELGLGDQASRAIPTLVDAGPWARAALGWGHTCAVREDRSLWCWGLNEEGQLGLGDRQQRSTPTQLPGSLWGTVSSSGFHTCALDAAGEVYCWGANDRGQLGLGDLAARSSPARVDVPKATRMATGRYQSCVILVGGELRCWGGIDFPGPAGGGAVSTPRIIGEGAVWTSVDAGYSHLCATQSTTLFCWGDNGHSRLGLGDTMVRPMPVPVPVP